MSSASKADFLTHYPCSFSAHSTFFIFVYELHFMGCILHTINIELRPRLVSLGRFFCSILLGYSLLGISPKPFNLFYCSSRFYEKRPNRSDCLPNYNCAILTCYIRPCLNWCKIGVIHSAALPSKYRFPRHYSGLVGSLCIFSALRYISTPLPFPVLAISLPRGAAVSPLRPPRYFRKYEAFYCTTPPLPFQGGRCPPAADAGPAVFPSREPGGHSCLSGLRESLIGMLF